MVLAWTEEVAMASDAAEPIERWTAKRRVALFVGYIIAYPFVVVFWIIPRVLFRN
jgi:hypothetical protein